MALGGADDSVMSYYTYQLRCSDDSLYAGIAADLRRRMEEHFSKDSRCAKYTKSHPPCYLTAVWESCDRGTASRLEYRLKRLTKEKKEHLAAGGTLEELFAPEFSSQYRRLSDEELFSVVSEFVHNGSRTPDTM